MKDFRAQALQSFAGAEEPELCAPIDATGKLRRRIRRSMNLAKAFLTDSYLGAERRCVTMASTKEIKDRIKSVRETQKITNAMYLIASTKLRKAGSELANTRPYFEALRGEIKRVFRTASDVDSRYFYPPDDDPPLEGTYGCLVITADKGLAGAYNQNVIKEAEKLLAEHPDTKLFVVGEYGRHFFAQHNIPIEHSFLYTAQNPTLDRAREICALLLDGFLRAGS